MHRELKNAVIASAFLMTWRYVTPLKREISLGLKKESHIQRSFGPHTFIHCHRDRRLWCKSGSDFVEKDTNCKVDKT
jgi:hypothetical protein